MEKKDLEEIVNQLREISRVANDDLYDEISQIRLVLKDWDCQGEIPFHKRLVSLGVLQPSTGGLLNKASAAEDKLSPIQDVSSLQAIESQKPVEEPGIISQKLLPVENVGSEQGVNAEPGDPDDDLEKEMNKGFELLAQKKYPEARKMFSDLALKARGRLKYPAEDQVRAIDLAIAEEVNRRIIDARRLISEAPEDLDLQELAWLKVREIRPDDQSTLAELNRINDQRLLGKIKKRLGEISNDAKKAKEILDVRSLDTLRIEIEKLSSEVKSDEVKRNLYSLVETIRLEVISSYEFVNDKAGLSSTTFIQANPDSLKSAYKYAKEFSGPFAVDAGNIMKKGEGAFINSAEFLKFVREKYLANLRIIIARRIERSRAQRLSQPAAAITAIKEALEWLNDEVLSQDDKELLLVEKNALESTLKEAEILEQIFNRAKEKINQAKTIEDKAENSLKLILEAHSSFNNDVRRQFPDWEFYPKFPDIDQYIEDARRWRSEELAIDVRMAITASQQLLIREEFPEAQAELEKTERSVTSALADWGWKPESNLGRALEELQLLRTQIIQAQAANKDMKIVVDEVNQALKRFEQTQNARELEIAHQKLLNLTAEQRQHKIARDAQEELTQKQGPLHNWMDGEEAYGQERWSDAEKYYRAIRDSNFSHYQEARKRADRALAASLYIKACEEENRHQWRDAIDHYKRVVALFSQVGSDTTSNAFHQRADEAVKRLEPVEKNDNRVRDVVNKGKGILQDLKNGFSFRQTLRDKLDPLPGLEQIIKELKDIQKLDSTLGIDITMTLSEIRQIWHDAYMRPSADGFESPIQQALKLEDMHALQLARLRCEELYQEGLITEVNDYESYVQIHRKYLDREFEQLSEGGNPKGTVNSDPLWREKEIEYNKRQVYDLLVRYRTSDWKKTEILVSDRKKAAGELQKAIRTRILAELKYKTPAEGLNHLKEIMEKRTIDPDPVLVQRLVELCWETGEWKMAEAAIRQYGENFENKNEFIEVWRGLNQVARYYFENEIELGHTQAEELRRKYLGTENADLIEMTEKEFRKISFERLLYAAQVASKGGTDENMLEAAEKYALAYQIEPDHGVLQKELNQLGQRVQTVVVQRCDQAKNLSLGIRDLRDTLDSSGKLRKTLVSIHSVMQELHLDENTQIQLQQVLKALNIKIELWSRVKEETDLYEKELELALKQPDAINLVDGSGGWDLTEAGTHFQIALGEAKKDKDLIKRMEKRNTEFSRIEQQATQIRELVFKLLGFVQTENFAEVIKQCSELEKTWNSITTISQSQRLSGLELLLKYTYPSPIGEVSSIVNHRHSAERQQKNFEDWGNWVKKIMEMRKNLDSLNRNLALSLDEVVQNLALKDVIKESETGVRRCDEFVRQLNAEPVERPVSNKARELAAKAVIESEQTYGLELRKKLEELKKEAMERQKILFPKMQQFHFAIDNAKNVMKKNKGALPPSNQEVLDKFRAECLELDPMNEDITKLYESIIAR